MHKKATDMKENCIDGGGRGVAYLWIAHKAHAVTRDLYGCVGVPEQGQGLFCQSLEFKWQVSRAIDLVGGKGAMSRR